MPDLGSTLHQAGAKSEGGFALGVITRGNTIGKKNWLFVGHPEADKRSAVLYSLIVSCLRHGKDPHLYLRDVLTRLPLMTNQDDLAPLLPKNWQPAG